jgi:hypothetical protein
LRDKHAVFDIFRFTNRFTNPTHIEQNQPQSPEVSEPLESAVEEIADAREKMEKEHLRHWVFDTSSIYNKEEHFNRSKDYAKKNFQEQWTNSGSFLFG